MFPQKQVSILGFSGLCLVCAVASLALFGAEAQTKHRQFEQTEFGTGIRTGSTLVQYHETCVWVRVFLISGDFFDHFKEEDSPAGPRFSRGGAPVSNFPDRVIADVEATVWKCNPKSEMAPPDYAAGLMTGASFEASWKSGTETTYIPLLFTDERHRPGLRWSYFLGIPAKGIPLTDSLRIDVSLRQGISRTALSAGLVSSR